MASALFDTALRHAATNRLDLCAAALEALLAAEPTHVEGLRLHGKLLLLGGGAVAAGLERLRQATRLAPEHVELPYEIGVACLQAGRADEAVDWFRRQLALTPARGDARFNLAWALRQSNRLEEAIGVYQELVDDEPGNGAAWYNLANALTDCSRLIRAQAAYERALALRGPQPELVRNAAICHLRANRGEAALQLLRLVAPAQRSFDLREVEAEALMLANRCAEAADLFGALLSADPGRGAALRGLVRCLRRLERTDEAAAVLEAAWARNPDDADLALTWAQAALAGNDTATALRMAAFAAERLGVAEAYATLGQALALAGQAEAAAEVFRRGVARHPDNYALYSNLLFALLHDSNTAPEAVFAEHQAYGRHWECKLPAAEWRPTADDTPGRRLRIGYVSPDFCQHAVALFFEPVLDGHNPQAVEVFCYHIPRREDEVTARMRAKAAHWRPLVPGDIEAAIAQIRADRIDILVDLAGHTAANMLPLFAARPAPIQMSCIGYPGTTGLTRMDYRLTYGMAPKSSDQQRFSTEKLAQLRVQAFQPPPELPEVTPPPFLRNGHLTFGSVGKFAKVSEATRRLWARVLAAVPEARLLVVAPGVDRPDAAAQVLELFAAAGADTGRIVLRPACDFETWLGILAEVDVVLDTIPYAGGTTAMLVRWMGQPLVRIGDEPAMGELGWFSTPDEDCYVAEAIALAADRERLLQLRASLRARLIADDAWTPDLKETRNSTFAPELEMLYRQFWHHYLREGRQ